MIFIVSCIDKNKSSFVNYLIIIVFLELVYP